MNTQTEYTMIYYFRLLIAKQKLIICMYNCLYQLNNNIWELLSVTKKLVTKWKKNGILLPFDIFIRKSTNIQNKTTRKRVLPWSSFIIISAGGVITLALLMLICGITPRSRFTSIVTDNGHELRNVLNKWILYF